jgi:phosphoglycolate phosphatase
MIAARWRAEPELSEVDVLEVVERHFHDLVRYPPRAVGDLAALCDRLLGRGMRLGLATMDSTRGAEATAVLLGIRERLLFVAGSDAGHGVKPDTGLVHAFCGVSGLAPWQVAMVGDTPADLEMGRNAGCGLVVGVLTGGAPARRLAPLADHVIASVMELEPLLG